MATVPHNCRPLWTVPGHPPVATCSQHYGQPVGVTASAPVATR